MRNVGRVEGLVSMLEDDAETKRLRSKIRKKS